MFPPSSHRMTPWVVVGLTLLAGVSTARGEERPRASLDYEPADDAGCPDLQGFRDVVAGRLGYDPFDGAPADGPTLVARIVKEGPHLVGRVTLRQGGEDAGTRRIEAGASECPALATSMAVAISILLDPFGLAMAEAPETEPTQREAEPEPTPEPEPEPPPPAPESPEEPGEPLALWPTASVAGHAGTQLAPGPTMGPRLALGVRLGAWSFLAEGRVDWMVGEARTQAGDRLEASAYSAGPAACVHVAAFFGCASVQLGAFLGRGVELVDPETKTSFFASADARLGGALTPTEGFELRAFGELRAALVRTALAVEGTTVWNAPPLAFGGGLEAAVTFF